MEEVEILDFSNEEFLDSFWDWTVTIGRRKTGLKVDIWSKWGGAYQSKENEQPNIIIGKGEYWNRYIIVVTISPTPQIIAKTPNITEEQMKELEEGIKYVAKNYDLFLKHYNDKDENFDDEDLFNALIERGEYRKKVK